MEFGYEQILVVKTAWYYYIEGLTQADISKMLGISRMRVIRLLEKARQSGVIQFNIRKDSAMRMDIEKRLTQRYQLKDTFVIPTAHGGTQQATNINLARAAAMYINDRLTTNRFINVGYGDTPGRVLNELAMMAEEPISCVSLTGGVNNYLPNANSNIFNAKLYLLPTPLIASSKALADAMREEISVQEIFRMARLSAFTVVGVGGMDESATIFKTGILTQHDHLYLKMQGAVGDVLSHFLDKDGQLVDTEKEDCLLSTPLADLKEQSNVIGVAAGLSKVDAIKAALRGGYLDILITDEQTAAVLADEG